MDNTSFHGLADVIDLLQADRERGKNDNHIAQWPEEDTFTTDKLTDLPAATLYPRVRFFRGLVLDQLDPGNQTALTDMANMRSGSNPRKVLL